MWSAQDKFISLPSKYDFLVFQADRWGADAYCVWDDDDIYLPWHLIAHAESLSTAGWSHPKYVWTLFPDLAKELAARRFHAALAIRRDYAVRVNYWGKSTACGYDTQLLDRLAEIAPCGYCDTWRQPSYVSRWSSTGADHCSGRYRNAEDTTWYTDTPISQPGYVTELKAQMDDETAKISSYFAAK